MSKLNTLRQKYHMFMREFVNNKYLKNFENVKVLGERFIFNYYIVIFQSFTRGEQLKIYIIVENINNPIKPLDLQAFKNSHGYIVTKQSLLKNLPEKLYKKLIDSGIFEKLETAQNQKDSTFSIHRLVLSLYTWCLNQKVHHINYCRGFSAICNLINLIKQKHNKLHRSSKDNAKIESLKAQNKLKRKLVKPRKNTLAENSILELLKLKIKGMKARQIEKKIFRRVKKSKIQEILNYFYYTNEFIIWLEKQSSKSAQDLYGQFKNRWEFILKFDESIDDEKLDITWIQDYLSMDNI